MAKRGWVAVGVAFVIAIVVGATAAIVILSTGWFDQRPPTIPACPKILAAPVDGAVRTAFATLWDQRRTQFSDTGYSSTCDFSASSDVTEAEPGAPQSRSLNIHLLREAPSSFQARRIECRPASNATEFTEEHGLGDESFSCWVTYEVKPFAYADRRLFFRVGELSFLLSLSGADYGPQTAGDHTARLRGDLAGNLRCIAEALASRHDAPPTQQRTCPGTATNM